MFGIPTVTIAKTELGAGEEANDVTLTVDTSTLSFTAKHLFLRVSAAHDSKDSSGYIRFNGDTGSNYNSQYQGNYGTTENAGASVGSTSGFIFNIDDDTAKNEYGGGEWLIPDAFNTTTYKNWIGQGGSFPTGSANGLYYVAGHWASTAAITSVTFRSHEASGWEAGSYFELCVVDEAFNINEQIRGSDGAFSTIQEDGGNFPAADGDLVVISNLRNSTSGNSYNIHVEANSDSTTSNYQFTRMGGNKSTVFSSQGNVPHGGVVTGDAATGNLFAGGVHHIPNYSDGSNQRMITSLTGETTLTNTNDMIVQQTVTRWANTAAITSLDIVPSDDANWKQYSMISTYRIPSGSGTTNWIARYEASGDSDGAQTFSSIPQSYDHLELSIYARSDRSNVVDDMTVQFNGDTTTSNYDLHRVGAVTSTVTGSAGASDSSISTLAAGNESSNVFGAGHLTFLNYTKTDRYKVVLGLVGAKYRITLNLNRWKDTSAISSILVDAKDGSNFLTGTVIELKGISADIPIITFIPETRMF